MNRKPPATLQDQSIAEAAGLGIIHACRAREGAAPRALAPWLNLATILTGKVLGWLHCPMH